MKDDLRTRIAAVLESYGLLDQYGDPLPDEELVDVADAVIRELGLTGEWMSHPDTGTKEIRYVTEWETEGDQ